MARDLRLWNADLFRFFRVFLDGDWTRCRVRVRFSRQLQTALSRWQSAGFLASLAYQTQPMPEGSGRLILLGTSFSTGDDPEGFLGQLRSVFGRPLVAFVAPNNGYSGGFRMMKDGHRKLRRGDIVIWELPLCCLNLGEPAIATDFEIESEPT